MEKAKKKLVFCTYSSVYSSIVLERLLNAEEIDVVAIINSTRIINSDYSSLKGSLKQIQKTGWRYSTYLFLITDLFQWMQIVLKFKRQSLKTIHSIAESHGIPILDTKDINNKMALDFINRYKAPFLLAAHFNQLIKPHILDIPTLRCLNIHPSLLPSFKGVDPVFYGLLRNEKKFGVTLHEMAESFDTGDILVQKKQTFAEENCLYRINCSLFLEGSDLAISWIISDKALKPDQPVINSTGGYDSWPDKELVTKYSQSKNKLICISTYLSTVFTSSYK